MATGIFVVPTESASSAPGSPVDLRYAFALEGDLIAGLEITP
ncbi:hypothetical protein [Paracoccus aestuarii]|nr:hypothetical protein [Paracoccus aestuarii]